jgi:phosphohistidine phosphatase
MIKSTSAETNNASRLLLLVRHGEAVSKTVGLSDFERILTRKGAVECDQVAKELSEKKLTIDLMISSPADRALETAHLFAPLLRYPTENIRIMNALYFADSISVILVQLKRLPDSARIVAMFGHNPSLEELATYLVPDFSQAISKSAIAAISFDAGSWANLKKGAGNLEFLKAPAGRSKESSRTPKRPVL